MPLQQSIQQADLEQAFNYDPKTGLLTWKIKSRRTRPGDEAGTVTPRGNVVVSLRGAKLPAENVCWALTYGAWPKVALRMANGDRQDLRLANLQPYTRSFSTKAPAVAMRKYRAQQKEQADAERTAKALARLEQQRNEYPSISWSPTAQAFIVQEPVDMPVRVPTSVPPRRVIGRTDTLEDGIAMLEQHLQWLDLLNQPVPDFSDDVLDSTPGHSGVHAVPLRDILANVGYDPETGAFLHRQPNALYGTRVDKPFYSRPGSPRYVYVKGRKLYAHLLAWFFSTHTWPRPKSLFWRNGNPGDNSAANLAVTGGF